MTVGILSTAVGVALGFGLFTLAAAGWASWRAELQAGAVVLGHLLVRLLAWGVLAACVAWWLR